MAHFRPVTVLVAGLALSALSVPGSAGAQEAPLVRLGVIADPQYAPVPPRNTRYYANTLWKLSEAVEDLNARDLDFVVTVGDIIDRHVESYTHILPIYNNLVHDNYFVLGNHDYSVDEDYILTVPAFLGMEERYYDFVENGVRFIVIDGNDLSLFANPEGSPRHEPSVAMYDALVAEEALNAKVWNGGLSDDQLGWLGERLDAAEAAGEPVIVLGHYPLFPDDEHNLWNYQAVLDLLSAHDNVMAYLNGHNHAGNYGAVDGVHYVNLHGMVETPDETAYAIVEVYPDRLVIDGIGREPDRELSVPATSQ